MKRHFSSCYFKRLHQLKHLLAPFGKASYDYSVLMCKFPPDPICSLTITEEAKYLSNIILYKLSDIHSLLKRLSDAIAVFVLGQLDPIFLCMVAIHARCTN